MNLADHWGYCPHCLTIKSYAVLVRVDYDTDDGHYALAADNPTDPVWLIAWIRKHLDYENCLFTIGDTQNAFIPVAIVNGTPVCPRHMWQLTEPMSPYTGRRR